MSKRKFIPPEGARLLEREIQNLIALGEHVAKHVPSSARHMHGRTCALRDVLEIIRERTIKECK